MNMSCKLTSVGVLWALLSVLSALLCCASYYLPYWIKGILFNTTVYFGVFRRCNYLVKGKDGMTYVQHGCGRYTSFHDIPSTAWRACTVLIGLACGLLLLVSLTVVISCCAKDIITRTSAKFAGFIQFLADAEPHQATPQGNAFLLSISMAAYPSGWDHVEVRQACHSDSYKMGDCSFSWAFYVMAFGTILTLICVGLSCKAGEPLSSSQMRPGNHITVSYAV